MTTRNSCGARGVAQRWWAWFCVLALSMAALATACSADDPNVQSHAAQSLTRIQVTPANPTINIAATVTFSATINWADGSESALGSDLASSLKAVWKSSDATIATVDGNGVATGVKGGNVTITVSLPGTRIFGAASLTVSSSPVSGLAITPATASTPVGTNESFSVKATYADGRSSDISNSATWTSSDATIAAALDRDRGTFAGLKPGTATITATDPASGKTATATLTVTAVTLKALVVTPGTATLPVPAHQTFSAMGTFSDGSTKDITNSVTWSSG
ncbi:MAG: Ig-like domain-containing protein, partial [Polyangiales bacterium]